MLCHACENIFRGEFPTEEQPQTHHNTVGDFIQAVRDECWICQKHLKARVEDYYDDRFPWGGLRPRMAEEEKERAMILELEATAAQHGAPLFHCWLTESPTPNNSMMLSFNYTWIPGLTNAFSVIIYPQNDAEFLKVNLDLDLDINNVPCGHSMRLAKYWVERCTNAHNNCNINASNWLPSRLLHLNEPNSSKVRLVTTDSLVPKPYTTLSHCWGKASFFTHTAETSKALFAGVEKSLLPQTFRDAIYVTLELGIRYLWIDSLCIIQDDERDWVRESSTMSYVYQNGYCNIAATQSAAADHGFISEKPCSLSPLSKGYYVHSNWDNAKNSQWLLNHSPDRGHVSNLMLQGPLLYRGWAVQERILAPRVLHFCSNQIYWECHQHDACNSYPNGFPPQFFIEAQVDLMGQCEHKSKYQAPSKLTNISSALELWAEIVNIFCDCELTLEKDKLVAVSGIARAIKTKIEGLEYLAGLWRDSLETQLLWRTDGGTRPILYRAPSWSWASIDGNFIEYNNLWLDSSVDKTIAILQATVKPVGEDETGQVESGFLRLLGPLFTISIFKYYYDSQVIYDVEVNGTSKPARFCFPDTGEAPPVNLHCVPIVKETSSDNFIEYDCLLIYPTKEGEGTFKRWGIVRLQIDGRRGGFLIPVTDGTPHWNQIQNKDWLEYEEDHGDGKYTFTII